MNLGHLFIAVQLFMLKLQRGHIDPCLVQLIRDVEQLGLMRVNLLAQVLIDHLHLLHLILQRLLLQDQILQLKERLAHAEHHARAASRRHLLEAGVLNAGGLVSGDCLENVGHANHLALVIYVGKFLRHNEYVCPKIRDKGQGFKKSLNDNRTRSRTVHFSKRTYHWNRGGGLGR